MIGARLVHHLVVGLAAAGIFSLVQGCTSCPPRRPAALDPSNPDNAESASPPPMTVPATPAPRMEHMHHGGAMPSDMPMPMGSPGGSSTTTGDAGATVYSCPMHPEVRQPAPGRCPKCGMTLVPTPPATPAMNHAMDGGM